jgi:hypothetical protein
MVSAMRTHTTITSRPSRLTALVLIVVAISAGLSACSKPSPTCEALGDLQSSVQALRDVNVVTDGIPALQSAVKTVQTDLATLKSATGTQVGAQLTAMEAAATAMVAAAQQAVDSPGATTIAAVVASVSATVTAADALKAALPDC